MKLKVLDFQYVVNKTGLEKGEYLQPTKAFSISIKFFLVDYLNLTLFIRLNRRKVKGKGTLTKKHIIDFGC